MTEAEFDDAKQQAFREALARAAGPSTMANHITIKVETMNIARRRLLAPGIRVDVSVSAADRSVADAIAARLTEEDINIELERAGLPPATLLEAATVEEGADAEEATLSMGPWAVVGLTVGVTSVFTFGVWKMLQVLPEHPFTDENAQFALLQDFCDCALDWVSWGGTASAGDFDFSNDKDRVISGFVLVLSALGFVFFLVDLCSYLCNGKRLRKDILILKLGIEDFSQAIVYSAILASQAGAWGTALGLGQSLVFCGIKFLEIFKMVQDAKKEAPQTPGGEEMGIRSTPGRNQSAGTTNKQATATLGAPGPGVPQRPPQARVNTNNPMGPYAMGHAGQPIARF